MTDRKLYFSSIITPDGTQIVSRHRHDYKEYIDTITGDTYVLDGGTEYIRMSINEVPATPGFVYVDDPHELKRQCKVWGTYGKKGDEPFRYISVAEMEDAHLKILVEDDWAQEDILQCILDEIEWRKQNETV